MRAAPAALAQLLYIGKGSQPSSADTSVQSYIYGNRTAAAIVQADKGANLRNQVRELDEHVQKGFENLTSEVELQTSLVGQKVVDGTSSILAVRILCCCCVHTACCPLSVLRVRSACRKFHLGAFNITPV